MRLLSHNMWIALVVLQLLNFAQAECGPNYDVGCCNIPENLQLNADVVSVCNVFTASQNANDLVQSALGLLAGDPIYLQENYLAIVDAASSSLSVFGTAQLVAQNAEVGFAFEDETDYETFTGFEILVSFPDSVSLITDHAELTEMALRVDIDAGATEPSAITLIGTLLLGNGATALATEIQFAKDDEGVVTIAGVATDESEPKRVTFDNIVQGLVGAATASLELPDNIVTPSLELRIAEVHFEFDATNVQLANIGVVIQDNGDILPPSSIQDIIPGIQLSDVVLALDIEPPFTTTEVSIELTGTLTMDGPLELQFEVAKSEDDWVFMASTTSVVTPLTLARTFSTGAVDFAAPLETTQATFPHSTLLVESGVVEATVSFVWQDGGDYAVKLGGRAYVGGEVVEGILGMQAVCVKKGTSSDLAVGIGFENPGDVVGQVLPSTPVTPLISELFASMPVSELGAVFSTGDITPESGIEYFDYPGIPFNEDYEIPAGATLHLALQAPDCTGMSTAMEMMCGAVSEMLSGGKFLVIDGTVNQELDFEVTGSIESTDPDGAVFTIGSGSGSLEFTQGYLFIAKETTETSFGAGAQLVINLGGTPETVLLFDVELEVQVGASTPSFGGSLVLRSVGDGGAWRQSFGIPFLHINTLGLAAQVTNVPPYVQSAEGSITACFGQEADCFSDPINTANAFALSGGAAFDLEPDSNQAFYAYAVSDIRFTTVLKALLDVDLNFVPSFFTNIQVDSGFYVGMSTTDDFTFAGTGLTVEAGFQLRGTFTMFGLQGFIDVSRSPATGPPVGELNLYVVPRVWELIPSIISIRGPDDTSERSCVIQGPIVDGVQLPDTEVACLGAGGSVTLDFDPTDGSSSFEVTFGGGVSVMSFLEADATFRFYTVATGSGVESAIHLLTSVDVLGVTGTLTVEGASSTSSIPELTIRVVVDGQDGFLGVPFISVDFDFEVGTGSAGTYLDGDGEVNLLGVFSATGDIRIGRDSSYFYVEKSSGVNVIQVARAVLTKYGIPSVSAVNVIPPLNLGSVKVYGNIGESAVTVRNGFVIPHETIGFEGTMNFLFAQPKFTAVLQTSPFRLSVSLESTTPMALIEGTDILTLRRSETEADQGPIITGTIAQDFQIGASVYATILGGVIELMGSIDIGNSVFDLSGSGKLGGVTLGSIDVSKSSTAITFTMSVNFLGAARPALEAGGGLVCGGIGLAVAVGEFAVGAVVAAGEAVVEFIGDIAEAFTPVDRSGPPPAEPEITSVLEQRSFSTTLGGNTYGYEIFGDHVTLDNWPNANGEDIFTLDACQRCECEDCDRDCGTPTNECTESWEERTCLELEYFNPSGQFQFCNPTCNWRNCLSYISTKTYGYASSTAAYGGSDVCEGMPFVGYCSDWQENMSYDCDRNYGSVKYCLGDTDPRDTSFVDDINVLAAIASAPGGGEWQDKSRNFSCRCESGQPVAVCEREAYRLAQCTRIMDDYRAQQAEKERLERLRDAAVAAEQKLYQDSPELLNNVNAFKDHARATGLLVGDEWQMPSGRRLSGVSERRRLSELSSEVTDTCNGVVSDGLDAMEEATSFTFTITLPLLPTPEQIAEQNAAVADAQDRRDNGRRRRLSSSNQPMISTTVEQKEIPNNKFFSQSIGGKVNSVSDIPLADFAANELGDMKSIAARALLDNFNAKTSYQSKVNALEGTKTTLEASGFEVASLPDFAAFENIVAQVTEQFEEAVPTPPEITSNLPSMNSLTSNRYIHTEAEAKQYVGGHFSANPTVSYNDAECDDTTRQVSQAFSLTTNPNSCAWSGTAGWTVRNKCNRSDTKMGEVKVVTTAKPRVVVPSGTAGLSKSNPVVVQCTIANHSPPLGTALIPKYPSGDFVINNAIASTMKIVENVCWAKEATFTWTVDKCGTVANEKQYVVVNDDPPGLVLSPTSAAFDPNPQIKCNAEEDYSSVIPEFQATDDCAVVPTVNFIVSKDQYPLGPTCKTRNIEQSWTAWDDCREGASQSQEINIVDDEGPVFSEYRPDVTQQCHLIEDPPALTAHDECDSGVGSITFREYDPLAVENRPTHCHAREINRLWQVPDTCSNLERHQQVITVIDTVFPEWDVTDGHKEDESDPSSAPKRNLLYECNDPRIYNPNFEVKATDNCNVVEVNYLQVDPMDYTQGYGCRNRTVERTWDTQDGCGNAIHADQSIEVIDVTPPVFQDFDWDVEINFLDSYGTNKTNSKLVVPVAYDDCTGYEMWLDSWDEIIQNDAQQPVIARSWRAQDKCTISDTDIQHISVAVRERLFHDDIAAHQLFLRNEVSIKDSRIGGSVAAGADSHFLDVSMSESECALGDFGLVLNNDKNIGFGKISIWEGDVAYNAVKRPPRLSKSTYINGLISVASPVAFDTASTRIRETASFLANDIDSIHEGERTFTCYELGSTECVLESVETNVTVGQVIVGAHPTLPQTTLVGHNQMYNVFHVPLSQFLSMDEGECDGTNDSGRRLRGRSLNDNAEDCGFDDEFRRLLDDEYVPSIMEFGEIVIDVPSESFVIVNVVNDCESLGTLHGRLRNVILKNSLDASHVLFSWINEPIAPTTCQRNVHLIGAQKYHDVPGSYGFKGSLIVTHTRNFRLHGAKIQGQLIVDNDRKADLDGVEMPCSHFFGNVLTEA